MLENTSTYVPMTTSTRLIAFKVLGFLIDISSTHTFKLLRSLLRCKVLDKNHSCPKKFF